MSTPAAQFQYMVQWFEEWSDFQRQDFLPIIAEKISSNGVHVNGLVDSMSSLNCGNKPMSIFQCRVKLFNDWFKNWNAEDQNKFVKRISELDEDFGVKLNEELSGNKQVIDNDLNDDGLVTAVPGNIVSEKVELNGEEDEIENREIVEDPEEISKITINDNQIPIEIVE